MTRDPSILQARFRVTDKYIRDTHDVFADLLKKLETVPSK